MLWQRISELIKEHQNFSPLLFFPFGLFGLKVRNPQNILWSLTIQASAGSTEVQAGTALQGQYHRCDKSYLMETCSHCSNRREWGGHQQPAYEGRLVGCCAQGGTISGSNNNCQVEREDSAAEYKSKQLQKQSLFVKISTEISPSDGKHFIIITMKD